MTEQKILSLEERDSYDLFKDEGIRSIVSKIPESQRKTGQEKGAYIYSVDYDKITGDSKNYIDNITFIREGMKSGLRPAHLEKDELDLIRQIDGEKWYETYGYSSETD